MIELLEEGMRVVRCNFSHGDYDYHASVINNAREAAKESGIPCAIMLDTKGPEIRTGKLKGGKDVLLVAGSTFTLVSDETILGDETVVATTYKNLAKMVKLGDQVLIDDGLISLTVVAFKDDGSVECRVDNNGALGETKGVNLPGVVVDLPAVTEKDKRDIEFGVKMGVDIIAASFIRKAADVAEIRNLPGVREAGIHIMSKIESQEGLDNFNEILDESDAIMVARGDLGVEIPIYKVATAQKMMIAKCNAVGKPVITATQMLESMVNNPRPTRAEATDVANAVFDGSDCVMLSGETSVGKYPLQSVRQMNSLCKAAEEYLPERDWREYSSTKKTLVESVAKACHSVSREYKDLGYKGKIIVITESGFTASMVSKYRPPLPIVVITPHERVAKELNMTWGVCFPICMKELEGQDAESRDIAAIKAAYKAHFVEKEDHVILVNTQPSNTGNVHMAIYDMKTLTTTRRI